MKKAWIFLLVFLCLPLFLLPAKEVDAQVVTQLSSLNPELSHRGGYYDSGFYLEITPKPGTTVFYTLDSSDPNQHSMKYTEPIWIDEKWIEATGEMVEIERKAGGFIPTPTYPISLIKTGSQKWQSPREDVFAATVVKVIAYDTTTNHHSKILTNTYFVHENMSNKYSFNVMSITTDIHNLYDYYEGINIPGYYYDNRISETGNSNRTGNYFQRGDEWEKPIYLEYFDTSGELLLAQQAGIRIHGGLSRKYPVKSYRLYARASYDNQSTFNYQFFEDKNIDKFKRLILRGGGQTFEYTIMGDVAAQEVIKPLTIDKQYSTPIILFLNGEYFGIRNIRDRFDVHYLASHYDLNVDDVTILSGHAYLDDGDPKGANHYQLLYQYITRFDMSSKKHFDYVEKRMDIDNFIDYNIAQLYFSNIDWPQNNVLYWRKNVSYTPDAPYGHDGRWRWMIYDLDAGFGASWGGYYPEYNSFSRITGETWKTGRMFIKLLENEYFRGRFIYRSLDLMETVFEKNRVMNIVDDMIARYAPEIIEHTDRYGYPSSYETWYNYSLRMKTFARYRPQIYISQMESFLNLGSKYELSILHDASMGNIQFNSFIQDEQQDVILKQVYAQTAFKMYAIPTEGHRFVGWYNQNGHLISGQKTLTMSLQNDYQIEARFEVGEELLPDVQSQLWKEILTYGSLFIITTTGTVLYLWIQHRKRQKTESKLAS